MELDQPAIQRLIKDRLFYNEFQPLWNTSKDTIFAYEAFIRTKPFMDPLMLFDVARNMGLLYKLDTASISNAIKEYPYGHLDKYLLFVNVFPSTIIHPDFPEFIDGLLRIYEEIKSKVVFEINEDPAEEHYWEEPSFRNRLSFLRDSGFLIAYDDLTYTSSSIRKIRQYVPDFTKLDRSCSQNLSDSLEKQKHVGYFVSNSFKEMVVVLEGIETNDDFLTAKQLGVPLLQGYFIAKPHRL
ncbi:EAL domain-containing protein [Bacillus sp. FJAT-49736]|uniref:EAL domain-containing protein n=1 Tax=Bacillus sp. FJAT-49736 TaxID=2833582 RepID=UPI001BCA2FAD|nr:EAL domain-containing protein [Bacillus sp. FJAT-49736]MBS4174241.1 EAL domain-containing protein [Bacillus sp. FJAT-49736]